MGGLLDARSNGPGPGRRRRFCTVHDLRLLLLCSRKNDKVNVLPCSEDVSDGLLTGSQDYNRFVYSVHAISLPSALSRALCLVCSSSVSASYHSGSWSVVCVDSEGGEVKVLLVVGSFARAITPHFFCTHKEALASRAPAQQPSSPAAPGPGKGGQDARESPEIKSERGKGGRLARRRSLGGGDVSCEKSPQLGASPPAVS